jgi:hypothetical protein
MPTYVVASWRQARGRLNMNADASASAPDVENQSACGDGRCHATAPDFDRRPTLSAHDLARRAAGLSGRKPGPRPFQRPPTALGTG